MCVLPFICINACTPKLEKQNVLLLALCLPLDDHARCFLLLSTTPRTPLCGHVRIQLIWGLVGFVWNAWGSRSWELLAIPEVLAAVLGQRTPTFHFLLALCWVLASRVAGKFGELSGTFKQGKSTPPEIGTWQPGIYI